MIAGSNMEKPFLLKSGLALFLTIAGFFAAARRAQRCRAFSSPPRHCCSPSDVEMEIEESVGTVDGGLQIRHTIHETEEEALAKIMPRAPVTMEEDHFPRSSESSWEEDEFPKVLFPGVNKHHQWKTETLTETFTSVPLNNYSEGKDVPAMEEEICKLKNLVQSLQERENYLEIQLLEFHGFKEQEISMRELQNRLKISSTETNLLSLKIESLKAENEKLRAKVSDLFNVTSELEMERKNVTILKSRMETVCKEAKEKITTLYTKIEELKDREKKDLEDVVQVEHQLKRLNELEDEVIKLQKEKSILVNEKSELMKLLSSENILSPPVIRSPDFVQNSKELRPLEELHHLRKENNKLKKETEQFQTDRCAEIEELIYLRWVNACLRYELRNYQLPSGRTIARDLSRCFSLNSEQKIKELILEYSNSGLNPNQICLADINLDDYSSQESSEECSETSYSCPKSNFVKPNKSKFIGKLKKLVLGKKKNNAGTPSSDGNSEKRASGSSCIIDEVSRRKSADSISSFSVEKASGNDTLDMDNLRRINLEGAEERMSARSKSDLGEVYGRKSKISVFGGGFNSFLHEEEDGDPEKLKLKKFAQVLNNSQEPVNFKSRPESLNFG